MEVRVGYSADDVLRTQLTPEIATAREVAAQWRQAVIEKGSFVQLGWLNELMRIGKQHRA